MIIESILLYGAETWTITKKLEKEIDGCYTRLLRHAQNIHWKSHIHNTELYGKLPRATESIRIRRLRLAGHCHRHVEPAQTVLFWKPTHGYRRPGRPPLDYVTLLQEDTGLEVADMKSTMTDREHWRVTVIGSGAPK